MTPVLAFLVCLLTAATVLWVWDRRTTRPRLASILFVNPRGEIVMTLAIPANGATRVGVVYLDQFQRRMDPPGIGDVQEQDLNDILSSATLENGGRSLLVNAVGAGSAAVTVESEGVIGTLFLSAQNPILTAIQFDEAGATFPTAAL